MNKDIILQSLTESFEILKDLWDTKKETIINCIVETEAYDGDLAMDMWLYVLQANKTILKTQEGVDEMITAVLERFQHKYNYYGTQFEYGALLEHVTPHMVLKEELVKTIFEESKNAGASTAFLCDYLLPACISGLLLQDCPQTINVMIKSMANNKMMSERSLSELIRKAYGFVELVYQDSDFNEKYHISANVKNILLQCRELIKDVHDRADYTITILAY